MTDESISFECKVTCYDCHFYDLKIEKHKAQRCGRGCLIQGTDEANKMCDRSFIPRQGGKVMDEIRKKHNSHMVFKIENLKEALTEDELKMLFELDKRIIAWRKKKGQTTMGYIVVNRDEDYAEMVEGLVLSEERIKAKIKGFEDLWKTFWEQSPPPLNPLDSVKGDFEKPFYCFIFFDADLKIPLFKTECTIDDAVNINDKGGMLARIYARESGKLLLSDGSDSKELLTVPFDDIPQHCEHGKAPGDCGVCAVGNPMSFHLSEGEREE